MIGKRISKILLATIMGLFICTSIIFADVIPEKPQVSTSELSNFTTINLATTDGSTIYYTLDGSIPTTDSQVYTTGIVIPKSIIAQVITIKIISVLNGFSSDVIVQEVAIKPSTPTGSSGGSGGGGISVPIPAPTISNMGFVAIDGTELNCTSLLPTVPSVGDVIKSKLNDMGEVESFTTLAVPDYVMNTIAWNIPTVTSNVSYITGLVKERKSNTITVSGGIGTNFIVPATANVYLYDERLSASHRVSYSDITDFDAKIATSTDVANGYATNIGDTFYDGFGEAITKVYAIARQYNSKIIDVMIYIFK